MIGEEEQFSAQGFFLVDKTTFMGIISNLIGYLIILLQFPSI